jgi:c-di-GMP-binding flagellar brake protein YcgR
MTLRAFCLDLSMRGAKLRVRQALQPDEIIVISYFRQKADVEHDEPLATMQAKVLHCTPAGGSKESPRFYAGIEFVDLEIAAKEAIARLMNSGTALIVRE